VQKLKVWSRRFERCLDTADSHEQAHTVIEADTSLAAAQASDSAVPMGQKAAELFKDHGAEGHGRLDFSSIYQHYSSKKV